VKVELGPGVGFAQRRPRRLARSRSPRESGRLEVASRIVNDFNARDGEEALSGDGHAPSLATARGDHEACTVFS
jgi:hypothetical protein